ncbi:hypothetical protein CCR84_09460 [Rhodocyclus purpureus]|nr:hypothetical protein [Rhodocyclus purpureus]
MNISPIDARTFYLRATSRAYNEAGADLTIMLRSVDGQWGQYNIDAPVVSHCAFEADGRNVFSLTPFGILHVARSSGFFWEKLDADTETSPNRLRHMRALVRAGQDVIAVGMARMAYRRLSNGRWERIDQSMRSRTPNCGLLAVDGCDESHIVAVGFGGEAWRFDGKVWSQLAIPTNVKLEQVRVVAPGKMAVCGVGGAMFTGQEDAWTPLALTSSRLTLWGLAYFEGRFYAADSSQIYVQDGDKLQPVKLPFSHQVTTGRLQACDGRLWSVGESDLLVYDGSQWATVPCP